MIARLSRRWGRPLTAVLLVCLLLVGGWWLVQCARVQDHHGLQSAIVGEWHVVAGGDQSGTLSHDPYGPTPYIFYPNGRLEVRHPFTAGLGGSYQVLDSDHIALRQAASSAAQTVTVRISGTRMVLIYADGATVIVER